MMNYHFTDRKEIICAYEEVIRALTDNDRLMAEIDSLQSECDVVLELMRQMVWENARAAGDQDEYRQWYGALMERYDAAKARLDEVTRDMERRNAKRVALEGFVEAIGKRESLLTEFDEELWNAVVEKMVVQSARKLCLFCGMEAKSSGKSADFSLVLLSFQVALKIWAQAHFYMSRLHAALLCDNDTGNRAECKLPGRQGNKNRFKNSDLSIKTNCLLITRQNDIV